MTLIIYKEKESKTISFLNYFSMQNELTTQAPCLRNACPQMWLKAITGNKIKREEHSRN